MKVFVISSCEQFGKTLCLFIYKRQNEKQKNHTIKTSLIWHSIKIIFRVEKTFIYHLTKTLGVLAVLRFLVSIKNFGQYKKLQ